MRFPVLLFVAAFAASPALADIRTIDHYVSAKSTVPAIVGQTVKLYVREKTSAKSNGKVVLFVHGAGTPAEVSFDPSAPGYSWMRYLAAHGYDVFAVDMEGWPFGAARAGGQPVQPVAETAERFQRPLFPDLSWGADQYRFGLERYRKRRRFSALAAARG